jgi:hypothetical protein
MLTLAFTVFPPTEISTSLASILSWISIVAASALVNVSEEITIAESSGALILNFEISTASPS